MKLEIQLHKILDVSVCWEIFRPVRWSEGLVCPTCGFQKVVKNGKDSVRINQQHYRCNTCVVYFDGLTDAIFSGSQQPIHH